MCRNIRPLFNYDPPTTEDEVRDAALQYVRKVSGMRAPSQVNTPAFDRAVERIAAETRRLIDTLETRAPTRDREAELRRRRSDWERREAKIAARAAASE